MPPVVSAIHTNPAVSFQYSDMEASISRTYCGIDHSHPACSQLSDVVIHRQALDIHPEKSAIFLLSALRSSEM